MKALATNRRARHDYDLTEHYLAGIVLAGHEVKSIKAGHISLKGSFVHFSEHEAWLTNAHVRLYSHASGVSDYDPTRPRKLLLSLKELEHLAAAKRAQGLTVIPTAVGVVRGLVKVEIALGKGRKHYDKRAVARAKAMKRDAQLDSKHT